MSATPIQASDGGVTISVWVVPGASRTQIVGLYGDKIKLRVAAPPEGGKANREAVSFLEKLLGADVELVRGMNSRSKVFQVARLDLETARNKLGLP